MITYLITMYDSEYNYNFLFECLAEDESHALEQAENAYPNNSIMSVELL